MSNSKIILIVNVLYLNMHMQAWFVDETSGEVQRLPRHCNPKEFVSLDYLAGQISLSISVSFFWVLFSLSHTNSGLCLYLNTELGVLYWRLNPANYENDEELKKIREDRGYNYMVRLICLIVYLTFIFFYYICTIESKQLKNFLPFVYVC